MLSSNTFPFNDSSLSCTETRFFLLLQVIVGSFLADGRKEPKPTNHMEQLSGPAQVNFGGPGAGTSSSPSRGTFSESSGGAASPPNLSSGACNNNHPQGMSGIPWKWFLTNRIRGFYYERVCTTTGCFFISTVVSWVTVYRVRFLIDGLGFKLMDNLFFNQRIVLLLLHNLKHCSHDF